MSVIDQRCHENLYVVSPLPNPSRDTHPTEEASFLAFYDLLYVMQSLKQAAFSYYTQKSRRQIGAPFIVIILVATR